MNPATPPNPTLNAPNRPFNTPYTADQLAGCCTLNFLNQVCCCFTKTVSFKRTSNEQDHHEDRHASVRYEVGSDGLKKTADAKAANDPCRNQRQENDED